jgi:hypothetical protein
MTTQTRETWESPYPMPDTDEEHGRLQSLQQWIRTYFGTNILAPMPSIPERIRTGPTQWD